MTKIKLKIEDLTPIFSKKKQVNTEAQTDKYILIDEVLDKISLDIRSYSIFWQDEDNTSPAKWGDFKESVLQKVSCQSMQNFLDNGFLAIPLDDQFLVVKRF